VQTASLALDTTIDFVAPSLLDKIARLVRRYAISAAGPVAMSGAHFLSAVLVLHTLSPVHFGFFSFVMTVVPFCVSAAAALIGAPTTIGIRSRGHVDAAELATFQKANLLLATLAFAVVTASLIASGLSAKAAMLFGLYGATMSLRWLGRVYAYATEKAGRAAASDVLYGALLVAGLGALYLLDRMTMTYAAVVLFAAAAGSLAVFDRDYLIGQFSPSKAGRLADYAPVWHDLTRWSLLGVAATELTINAHAYFVTFFCGPQSFALLALGSLLMRPVAVVLGSLPDMERPAMARAIGAGDFGKAFRAVKEFRTAAVAVLAGTTLIAAALLTFLPSLVLKQGYDASQAWIILGVWAAIMAVRAVRTPDAVFLQAAGEFQELAAIGMKASVVSLAATVALLFAFGPVASMLGIVAGDIAMSLGIFKRTAAWRVAHA
jgi:O-antigen/teichoic acid export membrane protein